MDPLAQTDLLFFKDGNFDRGFAESILKDRIIKQTRKLSEETENIITNMTALSSQLHDASNQLTTKFDSLSESYALTTAVNSN